MAPQSSGRKHVQYLFFFLCFILKWGSEINTYQGFFVWQVKHGELFAAKSATSSFFDTVAITVDKLFLVRCNQSDGDVGRTLSKTKEW